MSIPITQELLDTILQAQAAAADGVVLANISPDPAVPFLVAIHGRSVYGWDADEEEEGDYLGVLTVPAAAGSPPVADAEPPDDLPPPEEFTIMPSDEED